MAERSNYEPNIAGSREYLKRRRKAGRGRKRTEAMEAYVSGAEAARRFRQSTPKRKATNLSREVQRHVEKAWMRPPGSKPRTTEAGDALAKKAKKWDDETEGKPWEHGSEKKPTRRASTGDARAIPRYPRRTSEEEHAEAIREPKDYIVDRYGEPESHSSKKKKKE